MGPILMRAAARCSLLWTSVRHIATTQQCLAFKTGVVAHVDAEKAVVYRMSGQLTAEIRAGGSTLKLSGELPFIYEGEEVAVDTDTLTSRQPSLQLQPLHTSIRDYGAFARHLARCKLHNVTARAEAKWLALPPLRLQQSIQESFDGQVMSEKLTARQPEKLSRRLRELADARTLHMLAMESEGLGQGRDQLKIAQRASEQFGLRAGPLLRERPFRIREVDSVSVLHTALFMAEQRPVNMDYQHLKIQAILTQLERTLASGRSMILAEDLLHNCNTFLLRSRLDESELMTMADIDRLHKLYPGWLALLKHASKDRYYVMPRQLYRTELYVKRRLAELRNSCPPWIEFEQRPPRLPPARSSQLSLAQSSAVHGLLNHKLAVLTGGPGVGKTTLIRSLILCLEEERLSYKLVSFTGRAAGRMQQQADREASTVHAMVKYKLGDFDKATIEADDDVDVYIVDEASMMTADTFEMVLRSMKPSACLYLVGDVNQLQPIDSTPIFQRLIASGAVPVHRLTQVYRQDNSGRLVRLSNMIAQADYSGIASFLRASPRSLAELEPKDDFVFIDCPPEEIHARLSQLLIEELPKHISHFDLQTDCQIITPYRQGSGTATCQSINRMLQQLLCPGERSHKFAKDDKVICLRNDYGKGVYNGDIGKVLGIHDETGHVAIEFPSRSPRGPPRVVVFKTTHDLDLAYAITVHKAQGSEYEVVVIPVTHLHKDMLTRPLVYTAMTRARRLLICVGERSALYHAIRRAVAPSDQTLLDIDVQELSDDLKLSEAVDNSSSIQQMEQA
eukprot:TRINITY_DN11845_c0_g1_i5.p1 TRINITY_DN11845_c0_g1~~TRINITY_DN11845_c0_g1_i5.p1  ORF type:complete len:791 (+),score=161.94 TRINITY_DN11845_c0_g1_i5:76-2448(+)